MARKQFATTWCSQAWLNTLESFGWSSRLQRGKTYAQERNVAQLDILPGWIYGNVQGPGEKPHKVVIKLTKWKQNQWDSLLDALAKDADLSMAILRRDPPEELAELLEELDLSLFPNDPDEIVTDCSCPDHAKPCKHIAAVYYVLAGEFETDPLLPFLLRGIKRDDFLLALQQHVGKEKEAAIINPEMSTQTSTGSLTLSVADDFWRAKKPLEQLRFNYRASETRVVLLKALGPPPFWHGLRDFVREIEDSLQPLRNSGRKI